MYTLLGGSTATCIVYSFSLHDTEWDNNCYSGLEPAIVVGPVIGTFFLLLYAGIIATIAIVTMKRYKGQFSTVINEHTQD